MAGVNPFKPTFGVSPPLLVGRDAVIETFEAGIESSPGPGDAAIYTGPRGVGKTVMLNAVERIAQDRGWAVISETANEGLIARLVAEAIPSLIESRQPRHGGRRKVSGVALPVIGGGVTWDTSELHKAAAVGLRNQLYRILDLLAGRDVGLLLTLDELHPTSVADLRQLFAVVQHARREQRQLAVAAAGLPSAVDALLELPGTTFLQRADRHDLGAVDDLEAVAEGLRTPIAANGRVVGQRALGRAVEATEGYPFMMQLVGFHIWNQHPTRVTVTPDDVDAGVAAARRRIGQLVHEPSLRDTSAVDRTFLLAMAQDDGPSRFADIAARMDVNFNYASQYRLRLLRAELIRVVGYGQIDFAIPYLREYLRDHAAALVGKGRAHRRSG